MNRFFLAGVVVLAGALGLSACGDKPESNAQITAEGATPTAAPALAAPVGQRYDATLTEGIDFRKGYPNFVAEISGMSALEPWGSWTSGPVAKFRFKQALPKKFTLEIVANAFGPNTGAPVKVRVGSVEKTFVITKTTGETFRLAFETEGTADTMEITPPKPTSPHEIDPKNNVDPRKLGIGLISLKIIS